jgi:hypothetical protein
MEPAYFSAFAALAGTTIGALTSLAASWLNHHVQFREQQRASDLNKREELYKTFIEEASRWYVDAFEHNQADLANLVPLYALISRMRVLSSPRIVESADGVVRAIIETYLAPNKTIRDLQELSEHHAIDYFREFSEACREELRGRGLS